MGRQKLVSFLQLIVGEFTKIAYQHLQQNSTTFSVTNFSRVLLTSGVIDQQFAEGLTFARFFFATVCTDMHFRTKRVYTQS